MDEYDSAVEDRIHDVKPKTQEVFDRFTKFEGSNGRIALVGETNPKTIRKLKNHFDADEYIHNNKNKIPDGLESKDYVYANGSYDTCLSFIKRSCVPTPPCFDDTIMEKAFEQVLDLLAPFQEKGELTSMLDVQFHNTSSGFYGKAKGCPTKPQYMTKYFKTISSFVRAIEQGHLPRYNPVEAVIKEEVTKIKKVLNNDERIFIIDSMECQLIYQIMFKDMNEFFKNSSVEQFLSGYSHYYRGADKMARAFEDCVRLFESDVSALDLCQFEKLMRFVYRIRLAMFSNRARSNPAFTNLWNYIFWTLEYAQIILPNGMVVSIPWITKSGCYNTSTDNTLAHLLVFAYSILVQFPSITSVWKHFPVRLMSDDNLWGIRKSSPYVNVDYDLIVKSYKQCGWDVDKSRVVITDVTDFRSDIRRHSILGCCLRWSQEERCYVPVPSKITKLFCSLIMPNTDAVSFFVRVSALAFLSFYDKPLYKYFKEIINWGLINKVISREQLEHYDIELGLRICYPSESFCRSIYVGLQSRPGDEKNEQRRPTDKPKQK